MNIFDLSAKITLDSSQYEGGLRNAIKGAKDAGSSVADLIKKYAGLGEKMNESAASAEKNSAAYKVAEAAYKKAQKTVEDLTTALEKSVKESGAESEESQRLGKELQAAAKEADSAKKALDGFGDAAEESGEQVEDASKKVGGFGEKLKSGLAVAAKAAGAALAAAGAAVVSIGKQAIESYANYEQLVGGVETLFTDKITGSTEAVEAVMKNASNAFKTAGLSANEYMETVTSFSAALLNSVGGDTKRAADLADMAITDMADNANKMGTSLESLQNAYTGFSRGNFTMLDNLALGFSGTKEGMQQLLDKAEELSGVKYDISSYADIVDAIHVVQTEMGITGTTAKEASETISGSVNMMKSSWQNLITGIADDNADFDSLINNFVDSVSTVGKNIIPRVETTLKGIGKLVKKLVPIISEELPKIVNDILPDILESAVTLVNGLLDGVVNMLPVVVQSGGQVLMSLLQGILDSTPQIVEGVMAAINAFIDFVTQNLPQIIEMGFQILAQLTVGIIKAIPHLVAKIPEIIKAIINGLKAGISGIIDVGKNIVQGVWQGIQQLGGWLRDKVQGFFSGIVDGVKNALGIHSPSKVFAGIGKFMALGLGEGWDDEYSSIKRDIEGGLDFSANANISPSVSAVGTSSYGGNGGDGGVFNIVVQSVLDGRVIGETAYKYNRNKLRAAGV